MSGRFVHELFEQAAVQHADRTAIAGSDRELTFSELDGWSNNIANRLIELGARKGAIVFVAAESTFSVVSSMLAVMRMGGVFVPIEPHPTKSTLRLPAAQTARA